MGSCAAVAQPIRHPFFTSSFLFKQQRVALGGGYAHHMSNPARTAGPGCTSAHKYTLTAPPPHTHTYTHQHAPAAHSTTLQAWPAAVCLPACLLVLCHASRARARLPWALSRRPLQFGIQRKRERSGIAPRAAHPAPRVPRGHAWRGSCLSSRRTPFSGPPAAACWRGAEPGLAGRRALLERARPPACVRAHGGAAPPARLSCPRLAASRPCMKLPCRLSCGS